MHSQRGYSVHRRHLEQQSYLEKTQLRYLQRLPVPEEIRYRDLDPTKSLESAIYSPVSNIGDIWSLKEGADESAIVLDIDKVGLDAFLQQFV